MRLATSHASSMVLTLSFSGSGSPISWRKVRKKSRSSERLIVSSGVPKRPTL